jgi:hypothetical protein
MELESGASLAGDILCLSCGRALARAVTVPPSAQVRLIPARGQSEVQTVTGEGGSLRCRRCNGWAFLERSLTAGIESSSGRDSLQRVA